MMRGGAMRYRAPRFYVTPPPPRCLTMPLAKSTPPPRCLTMPHAESTESAEFFLEHESPEFHKFCFLTQPPLSFFVMKNTQKLCIINFFAIFATKFFITMSYGNQFC